MKHAVTALALSVLLGAARPSPASQAHATLRSASVGSADVGREGGAPPDSPSFGNTFVVTFEIEISKGSLPINDLILQWTEKVDWYKKDGGSWVLALNQDLDPYADRPTSNVFAGWNNRYQAAARDRSTAVGLYLADLAAERKTKKKLPLRPDEEEELARQYLAKNGGLIKVQVSGRQLMAFEGGGAESPVTGDTRRRVIHFDLGVRGKMLPRATATQILETDAGKITIWQFMAPGIPEDQTASDSSLADWRAVTAQEIGKKN
jgi:hypothetical protein